MVKFTIKYNRTNFIAVPSTLMTVDYWVNRNMEINASFNKLLHVLSIIILLQVAEFISCADGKQKCIIMQYLTDVQSSWLFYSSFESGLSSQITEPEICFIKLQSAKLPNTYAFLHRYKKWLFLLSFKTKSITALLCSFLLLQFALWKSWLSQENISLQ